jgi:uncharacterized repeat protein (TIGR01451 family)
MRRGSFVQPLARVRSSMRAGFLSVLILCVFIACLIGAAKGRSAATEALPSGFQESIVFSGLTNPTTLSFAPDGRVFVAEKGGLIKVFDSLSDPSPSVFADLRSEVYNFWDRGLLGLALDPGFPTTPYVYVLYSYDAPIGGAAPRWGTIGVNSDTCPTPPGPTTEGCVISGRLSRLGGPAAAAYRSQVMSDAPVGYWRLNETVGSTAVDESGGGNAGAYVSGSVLGADGPIISDAANKAVSFGATGYVNVPDSASLSPTGAFTLEAWVRLNSLGQQGLIEKYDTPSHNGYLMRLQNGRLTAYTLANGTSTRAQGNTLLAANHWYHVAAVYNGTSLRVYVNGVEDGAAATTVSPTNGATSLKLGARGDDTAFRLDGTLDEAAVYNTALSQARLQAHFRAATRMSNEQVLIEDWCQQYPSHSIGTLRFGPDGKLYASAGEGASFGFVDFGQRGTPVNPCGDPGGPAPTAPTAEGGALRSQDLRTSADPAGLGGTIIRVDPTTGQAPPDNPLVGNPDVNVRRVIAYGLRNPFRFTFRPATSQLWLGDVGWNDWEEINRILNPTDATVENFGWPCYEGNARQSGYDSWDLNICENLYSANVDTRPFFAYHHSAKITPGETCPTAGGSSISGLSFEFSPTASSYPADYQRALFFSDYSRDCIWVMKKDANGVPAPGLIEPFVDPAANPVDIEFGPGGELYYVDFNGGTIRKIQFTSGNQPPTAVATADPTSGPVPLTVNFDGTGSSDPDPGDVLSYAWDLDGDGAFDDASTALATHVYTQAGTYNARLRVTDNHGLSSDSNVIVISAGVTNASPTATISTPSSSLTWQVADVISFAGSASDPEDGALPASALSWSVILHHCPSGACHTHPLETFDGVASGSFAAPDHEYPSHLELRLTATDSSGNVGTASVLLQPRTVVLTFQSSPAGLQLAFNGGTAAAPFDRTVIIGSNNSVSAPTPQTLNGVSYGFVSWSDGGAQSHNITAGSSTTTYTATYRPRADVAVVKTGTVSADRTRITFTLQVANNGPETASAVVATDVLSDNGIAYVSSSPSKGSCSFSTGSRTLTCALGSLTNGEVASITITANVLKSGGWVSNTATVGTSSADQNSSNNSSTVRVRIR